MDKQKDIDPLNGGPDAVDQPTPDAPEECASSSDTKSIKLIPTASPGESEPTASTSQEDRPSQEEDNRADTDCMECSQHNNETCDDEVPNESGQSSAEAGPSSSNGESTVKCNSGTSLCSCGPNGSVMAESLTSSQMFDQIWAKIVQDKEEEKRVKRSHSTTDSDEPDKRFRVCCHNSSGRICWNQRTHRTFNFVDSDDSSSQESLDEEMLSCIKKVIKDRIALVAFAPAKVAPSEAAPAEVVPTVVAQAEVAPAEITPAVVAQAEIAQAEIAHTEDAPVEVTQPGIAQPELVTAVVVETEVVSGVIAQAEVVPVVVVRPEIAHTEAPFPETSPAEVMPIDVAPAEAAPAVGAPSNNITTAVVHSEITPTEVTPVDIAPAEVAQAEVAQAEVPQTKAASVKPAQTVIAHARAASPKITPPGNAREGRTRVSPIIPSSSTVLSISPSPKGPSPKGCSPSTSCYRSTPARPRRSQTPFPTDEVIVITDSDDEDDDKKSKGEQWHFGEGNKGGRSSPPDPNSMDGNNGASGLHI